VVRLSPSAAHAGAHWEGVAERRVPPGSGAPARQPALHTVCLRVTEGSFHTNSCHFPRPAISRIIREQFAKKRIVNVIIQFLYNCYFSIIHLSAAVILVYVLAR